MAHAVRAQVFPVGAALFLLLGAGAGGRRSATGGASMRNIAEFRAHASDIKQDGRLLTVLDGDSLGWDSDQPYWHMAEFAVIDRDAFTPLMFTTAGQHIVHARPPLDRFGAATAAQGSPPDIDELERSRRRPPHGCRRGLSATSFRIWCASSAISTRRW